MNAYPTPDCRGRRKAVAEGNEGESRNPVKRVKKDYKPPIAANPLFGRAKKTPVQKKQIKPSALKTKLSRLKRCLQKSTDKKKRPACKKRTAYSL